MLPSNKRLWNWCLESSYNRHTNSRSFLLKEEYPEDKNALIKKCILNHRGSRSVETTTPEEICIADSDQWHIFIVSFHY